jgi:hypothetical protein
MRVEGKVLPSDKAMIRAISLMLSPRCCLPSDLGSVSIEIYG